MEKFSKLGSIKRYIHHRLNGDIYYPRRKIGNKILICNQTDIEIFRQVVFRNIEVEDTDTVLFHVKFKLNGMSPGLNKTFSNIPIPFFVGLPGFLAKFWCLDKSNSEFHGFYKWKSRLYAETYSSSFAMEFMTKRSIQGSTFFEILPYKNNKYDVYPDVE